MQKKVSLVEFLSDRIRDDVCLALSVINCEYDTYSAEWTRPASSFIDIGSSEDFNYVDAAHDATVAAYIVNYDPKRTLMDCKFKSTIIDRYDEALRWLPANVLVLEEIMKTMAVVYSDHPQYRTDW
jgi:hypothetical protein